MKVLTTKDKIWSWILILLPAALLGASMIPGIMRIYDAQVNKYIAGSMIQLPEGTVMSSINLPSITAMAYTVILGICYYRGQGFGMLKAIMIFGFLCAFLTALGLIVTASYANISLVKPWPYGALPLGYLVLAVLALIRLKQEQALYPED